MSVEVGRAGVVFENDVDRRVRAGWSHAFEDLRRRGRRRTSCENGPLFLQWLLCLRRLGWSTFGGVPGKSLAHFATKAADDTLELH